MLFLVAWETGERWQVSGPSHSHYCSSFPETSTHFTKLEERHVQPHTEYHLLNNAHLKYKPCRVVMAHAFRRQKQTDLCECKANLIYKASCRTARAVTQQNHLSKNNNNKSKPRGWRDGGSVAKNSCCLCRGSRFNSQYPHGIYKRHMVVINKDHVLIYNSASRGSNAFSDQDLLGHQAHI